MANPSSKEVAILQMQEWMSDSSAGSNTTLQLVSAALHMYDDNVKEAIKAVRHGSTIEQ